MKVDFKELGRMNVPAYCRKIMKKEGYPKTLEIYRGDMHCLDVDVEGAAKLRLDENTLIYKNYDKDEARRLAELALKGTGSSQGAI